MYTEQEIKEQYKKITREKHPDKSDSKNTEQMQGINLAYDVLKDKDSYEALRLEAQKDIVRGASELLGSLIKEEDVDQNLELFGSVLYAFND